MSFVLFDGLIFAAAQINPVNSSTANSIFSISCSGFILEQIPYPWLQMAWIISSDALISFNSSGAF